MIRKLEKKDIDLCVQICDINFKKEGYSYDSKNEFLSQFGSNIINLEFYVYESNNIIKGVAGLANCWFDNGAYGICTCYVLPEYQNQGIGKALTEFRINRIKELGGKSIFASTKKLWHLERFGFKEITSPHENWKFMQLICK